MKVHKFSKKYFPFLVQSVYTVKRETSLIIKISLPSTYILSKNFGHLKRSDEFSHAFIHFEYFFFLV